MAISREAIEEALARRKVRRDAMPRADEDMAAAHEPEEPDLALADTLRALGIDLDWIHEPPFGSEREF